MDIVNFELCENDQLVIDGIDFSRSLFIKPIINGEDVITEKFDQDALAVLSEWEKCAKAPGKYLLFTSLIGIADEGGWELCGVKHHAGLVSVKIPYNDKMIEYSFDEAAFFDSIKLLTNKVSLFFVEKPYMHLEPKNVVFPEAAQVG